jgi:hypothetical protein
LKGALHHLRPWLKSGIADIQVRLFTSPLGAVDVKCELGIENSILSLSSIHRMRVNIKAIKKFSPVNDFNFLNIHILQKNHFHELFFISRDFIIWQFFGRYEERERERARSTNEPM